MDSFVEPLKCDQMGRIKQIEQQLKFEFVCQNV